MDPLKDVLAAFERGEGTPVGSGRRSLARRLPWSEGGECLVKELFPRRGLAGVRERLRALVGVTRAGRAFEAAARLRTLSLPVAEPLGLDRSGPRPRLVLRWIEGTSLDALAADLELARRVAALVARLHAAGAVHGDLQPRNLVRGVDGAIWLLDLDRVKLHPEPAPLRARARDLARLRGAARAGPAIERAFLAAYGGERGELLRAISARG